MSTNNKITINDDNTVECPVLGKIDVLYCTSCKMNTLGTFVDNVSICYGK